MKDRPLSEEKLAALSHSERRKLLREYRQSRPDSKYEAAMNEARRKRRTAARRARTARKRNR